MWLPPTLKSRAADMKTEGLEIPVDQIYNDQGTGLNNAVVLFGKGCTGEIISSQGLVLTNHHCGYGAVQALTTREHDYFAAGFWAMSNKEELPCPGLTVTFIRKMENVTGRITYDLPDTMAEASRDSIVAVRIRGLEKGYKLSSGLDAQIKPYYNNNQYWVILSETYKDIRLVGFPPNGVGFFGGDTDNWMWPRHNGDFSVFRVYAGKDGKPADYSKDNKPYKPKQFFSINTSGYKEGDFTMVYGFPGTTQEYISSPQLDVIYRIQDPIRIAARTKRLEIWKKAMDADRDIFIKYTSKRASVANYWKKWQGELRGLRINNVSDKKREAESAFQAWANEDTTAPYADNLLSNIQATTGAALPALKAEEYIKEGVLSIELIAQGGELDKLLNAVRRGQTDVVKAAPAAWASFFKNYDPATDQKVFEALMPMLFKDAPQYVPSFYEFGLRAAGGDYQRWARRLYSNSVVTDQARFNALMAAPDTARIMADPAWQTYHSIADVRRQMVTPLITQYSQRIIPLNRLYLAAQMARGSSTHAYYPDANLTLRVSYGHVKGIDPEGPAGYSFQTNIEEIIAKDQPDNEEFRVPQKTKDLHAAKDYGRWSIPYSGVQPLQATPLPAFNSATPQRLNTSTLQRTVPVAFLADNHTTGGNSGSPVLNAKGQLIGTNFDRVWEGTMSDLYFDPSLCRNISVDIRYTLWVIEKFGGAGWLLKEMKLVK